MPNTDIMCYVSCNGEASMCGLVCTGGKKDVAPLARRAIKGLASMLTKDRCLQYQSESDALKVHICPLNAPPAPPTPPSTTHLVHLTHAAPALHCT